MLNVGAHLIRHCRTFTLKEQHVLTMLSMVHIVSNNQQIDIPNTRFFFWFLTAAYQTINQPVHLGSVKSIPVNTPAEVTQNIPYRNNTVNEHWSMLCTGTAHPAQFTLPGDCTTFIALKITSMINIKQFYGKPKFNSFYEVTDLHFNKLQTKIIYLQLEKENGTSCKNISKQFKILITIIQM